LVKRGREGREKAVGFLALAASLRRAATASFPSAARVVTFHFCPGCVGGERECLECRLASAAQSEATLTLPHLARAPWLLGAASFVYHYCCCCC
jgi:hypothetical protein